MTLGHRGAGLAFTKPRALPFLVAILCFFLVSFHAAAQEPDPLPSWNDGPAKSAILAFVADVTKEGSANFVPPSERIAVFDNDGTLWIEQPVYVQAVFALNRLHALAPKNPAWKKTQPFKAALEGDIKALLSHGQEGLLKIIGATHAGNTPEEFIEIVQTWLDTARHPRFKRRYTDLVYQPMLELLAYLRSQGFKTFIVSGGGTEFIRAFGQEKYGIPPEQIVGSSIRTTFEHRDGRPVLLRRPELIFFDDGAGKPVGINAHIGRRPIAVFGNSDGDLEMLQWTTTAEGRRLGVIIRHTDAEREYAYDRKSDVGRLNAALDAAKSNGWIVVDMKKDWKVIFPFEL
jgi:phosphoglycolate phosphatase-like HAD superfamily hydrolase